MKIRKKVAGLLAFTMLIGSTNVMGNVQDRLPQDAISPIVVGHTLNASTGDILPTAQITFKEVANSETSTTVPANDKKKAEYYRFIMEDSTGNRIVSEPFRTTNTDENTLVNLTTNIESHLEDVNKFRSGALYKVAVQPGHLHHNDRGEEIEAPLSNATKDPVRYLLTDFNTLMLEEEDEINVYWEYIPGATYKLVYIDKETDTKAGVDGTDGVSGSGVGTRTITIRDDEAQIVNYRNKQMVKCTLPDTIAGQKYSAYVMVTNISDSFLKVRFDDVDKNTTAPKIVQATRSVSLKVNNIGKNRIRLKWELGTWADNGRLKTTKIYRKLEGESNFTLIGTLNNAALNPRDPGKFEHDEPTNKAVYYVEFIFTGSSGDESIFTKEILYTPYELRDQPLKPSIPDLFTGRVEEGKTKADYLVSGDDVAERDMKANTFHLTSKTPVQMQLVWDPKKNESDVIDYGLAYDIWVTDNKELLDDETFEPVIKDFRVTASNTDNLVFKQDGRKVVGIKTLLNEYRDHEGDVKNLISNNTYYIKLVAKREYSGDFISSEPEMAVFSIDKNGDIFTPPVLAKPPLRVKPGSVTTNSAIIEWRENWCEIKALNPLLYSEEHDERFFAKLWNSKVYTGGTPSVKFVGGEGLTEHVLLDQGELDRVKTAVNAVEPFDEHYASRNVTLGSDVKYEVKTILYDDVVEQINIANRTEIATEDILTVEKWIIDNESDSTEGWNTVSPEEVTAGWKEYNVTGLTPNTRYFVLIRAYRVLDTGEKLMQTFPSYVIVTTDNEFTSEEPIPKVPILSAEGKTDHSISVGFIYDKNFTYEIHYGRLDDPNTATTWEFEISDDPGSENYVADQSKAIIKITGLAADTTYNVWIRAKQKVGNKTSSWSNPVTIRTDKLGVPSVPKGLGKAAYQSILEAGQDFTAVAKDYITVEWSKIPADAELDEEEEENEKVYTYVLEYADNPEFLDAVSVDVSDNKAEKAEVLSKTLVKVTGLEANMPYYFRVKAVLTYNNPETKQVVVLESEFCSTVRIYTTTSSGEYDGGENENVVTFDKPIEETFKNGIWTYEILDVATVTSGFLDNKQYAYTITMENYNNKYDANVRRIKMPKVVLDTLIKRGMALKIVTNRGIYDIPGTALKNYANKYSAHDIVQIDLTRLDHTDIMNYVRAYPETYQSGEKLEVKIKGSAINRFDEPIDVSLRLAVIGAYNYSNYSTYQYNYAVGEWTNYKYNVSTANNAYLTFATQSTGLNAIYERAVKNGSVSSSYSMNQISSKYNVDGLGSVYFKNDTVQAGQYVKLLVGIRTGADSIDLTVAATADEYTKASKAGIYIGSSSDTLTKEQALYGIVKLYELNTGRQIKPSNVKIKGTSNTYAVAVSKAYAIGLISDLAPQQKVTYEELCDWLTQVVE